MKTVFSQINSKDTVFDINERKINPLHPPPLHMESMQILAQLISQYFKVLSNLSLPWHIRNFLQFDILCSLSICHNPPFFLLLVSIFHLPVLLLGLSPSLLCPCHKPVSLFYCFLWLSYRHFKTQLFQMEPIVKMTSAGSSLPVDGHFILLVTDPIISLTLCPYTCSVH